MATYDAKIIHEFADRLYAKAESVIRTYTIIGVLLGLVAGGGAASHESIWVVLPAVIIGGLIGYMLGKDKAFQYKLQGQTALCQVQIEQNTGRS